MLRDGLCFRMIRLPPPYIPMKHRKSPRFGFAAIVLAAAPCIHAQNYDWGSWDNAGAALYSNGDRITMSSQSNASFVPAFNETSTPHAIIDPAFPFANGPGTGQVGFFHNEISAIPAWSVLIDLTDFTLTADTVIGFSNLDGRAATTTATGFAVIQFLDSDGNLVPVSTASFLGSYDVSWQGITWDANSTFDLNTGRWDVVPNSGSTHPSGSYFGNVGDAFFLTNLPTNIEKIAYYKTTTRYLYDSTLFYAGNPVNAIPEPSAALLIGLAGIGWTLRRKRPLG
jgi:PEP-CTERM motif